MRVLGKDIMALCYPREYACCHDVAKGAGRVVDGAC